jgi:hypothetical protein
MPDILTTDQPPPDAGHEDSDINVRGIIKFGAAMIVLGGLVHLLLAWMFWDFDAKRRAAQPKVSPLVQKERARLPQDLEAIPEPRLQPTETDDLARLRQREEKILTSYGVGKDEKTLRIPIQRAMELLADPKEAAKRGVRSG